MYMHSTPMRHSLAYRIDPKASVHKVRIKTKRVVIELVKEERGKQWKKLSAV